MIKSTLLSASMIALSLGLLSPRAYAALPSLTEVAASCTIPDYAKTHNTFYVDPIHGSATGDGSLQHPWNSLSDVIGQGKISTMPAHWDAVAQKAIKAGSANSPIHPGDVIRLMSGDYGKIAIQGAWNSGVYINYDNPDFITIEAASGQTPILRQLLVSGASKWAFRGLTIQGLLPNLDQYARGSMVSFTGLHHDVILDNSIVGAQFPVDGWTESQFLKNWSQSDWRTNAPSGVVDSGGGTCITITNNKIQNVGFGMQTQRSNNVLIKNNTLNYFSHDGIDHGSNNVVIQNNYITNHLDVGDQATIHPDFIQAQPYGAYSPSVDKLSNVLIDGNVGIDQTDPDLPLTLTASEWIQGITCFDGAFTNVAITNNVIIPNSGHGISFWGANGLLIANNTVLSNNLGAVPWIEAGETTHEGFAGQNTIIRNNISGMIAPATSNNLVVDHNLLIQPPKGKAQLGFLGWNTAVGTYGDHNVISSLKGADVFKTYDPAHFQYDLHLKAGTLAVGTGNSAQAPTKDIAGATRGSPVDLGAYVYTATATTPVITTPVVTTPVTTTKPVTTPGTTTPVVTTPVTPPASTPPVTAATAAYKGTVTLTANARQIGTPQLIVKVDGKVIGTAAVNADVHAGQVGKYTFNFSQPTHPSKLELILSGYTASVQTSNSLNVFSVVFGATGKSGTDVMKTGKQLVEAGNFEFSLPARIKFYTNNSTLLYNVEKN